MKKYQYLASWDDQTLTRVGEPVVVLGDSNVSQVEVTLPSDFLLDPTGAVARMYFLLPGEKKSGFETLETATKDDNGDSHVTWTIKHAHTQKGGRLAFSLTLIGDDAQWDSRTAIIPVYESRYQPESEEAEEPYTGRLNALEGSMAAIRGEFAEVQDDFEELKETATLGTPIPESLVANMQEGHVYIYTGTEPGYTAGHVYYYVGGALTDGGVYGGTAVDATLTQSGQAADAKKTGDEISAIKEDLSHIASATKNIEYVPKRYIATNVEVGERVDIEGSVSAPGLCYAIENCRKGDSFIITGDTHTLSAPRAWAFVDTNYNLISKANAGIVVDGMELYAPEDGYIIVNARNTATYSLVKHYLVNINSALLPITESVETLKDRIDIAEELKTVSNLVEAQKHIAEDWHFGFINMSEGMGLGSNHIIPGTKNLWSDTSTLDLSQNGIWMRDGVHPFTGSGVTQMYAMTILNQIKMVSPSYRNSSDTSDTEIWSGKSILWMGTSIPAGSDPDAGSGTGATYPELVAQMLGASCVNKSRGKSCVRINASDGEYTGMIYPHFLRALTRTVAECDYVASHWNDIKTKLSGSPDTLSKSDVAQMKTYSFENLLLPYLNGTYTMPDLFVIDHGHNDVRPRGVDGEEDLWVVPSSDMITSGILAQDSYMVDNDFANLKLALDDDLSGIADVSGFAASVNRNCFKGAVNFLITVILRYNPYARIIIVSDYD